MNSLCNMVMCVLGHSAGVQERRPLPELPAAGVAAVLCDVRPGGSVCAGERGGGCAHEASRREQQRSQ